MSHTFIYETLRKFVFSDDFVRWVQVLHNNIESCVLNDGFSTGYFALKRGTRQGYPLAPYLFILVLEVHGNLVTNNKIIEGIKIWNFEIKYCMFGDDTTFFLKDEKSFIELRNVLESFARVSLLQVNYDKSEAAILGSEHLNHCNEKIKCRWIDIYQESLKILGIHFSINSNLIERQNFDKLLESFKTTLNIWKSRNMTLHGNAVLKSLALSKIYYVTAMIEPPLVKFVWADRKPKLAYNVLISRTEKGGICLPDINCRVQTQQIMLIKRLLTSRTLHPWKLIPSWYLREIGGLEAVRSNFNVDMIPKNLPKYKHLIAYSKFVKRSPLSKQEVLIQPVWNNANIKLKNKSFYIRELQEVGVLSIMDIWSFSSKNIISLSTLVDPKSAIYRKHFRLEIVS